MHVCSPWTSTLRIQDLGKDMSQGLLYLRDSGRLSPFDERVGHIRDALHHRALDVTHGPARGRSSTL